MATKHKPITKAIAARVLEVVDAGLVGGTKGNPEPGQMCVESAVAYAMGEPHTDRPKCVHKDLRDFKIHLNDMGGWVSDATRAKGLRRIAIAQLGTAYGKNFNWRKFVDDLVDMVNEDHNPLESLADELRQAKTLEDVYTIRDELGNFEPLMVTYEADDLVENIVNYLNELPDEEALVTIGEYATQCLVKQKTPGSKFLYLTKSKKKAPASRSRKKK